mgnify:CR=1 FL=1
MCTYALSWCEYLGWRIGWAIAPARIALAIQNIHVKVTDCAPAPFQEAALTALRSSPQYFDSLRRVRSNISLFKVLYVLEVVVCS